MRSSLACLAPLVILAALFLTPSNPAKQVAATASDASQTTQRQWEVDAGGKLAFDVASVKQNKAEMNGSNSSENVPLNAGDGFTPTGGLFRATNIPLHWYIRFAYKLETTEFGEIIDELPRWATMNRYDIEARAAGDPNKDQYRLMMQALLADRFKLAVHFETKQMPVWGLVLNKPGKFGSGLRKHLDSVPCPDGPHPPMLVDSVEGGFPKPCGGLFGVPSRVEGRVADGARNVTMAQIANDLSLGEFGPGRPVVDETGLEGNYDFVIEFTRDPNDPVGPAFIDALKDQLGLRLVPGTRPLESIVVDHIEEPSKN
jgi:uncharacterized protein (TIGR03435 family)